MSVNPNAMPVKISPTTPAPKTVGITGSAAYKVALAKAMAR
jgi:mevalonate kinase